MDKELVKLNFCNFIELKAAYAKRLFKKYGFNRGALFENIPVRYKLHPLWSPSAYAACEGEQIAQWLMEGMEEGNEIVVCGYFTKLEKAEYFMDKLAECVGAEMEQENEQ